jgi:hypothetical protein
MDITRSLSSDDLDRDDLQDAARELGRALEEVGLDAPLATEAAQPGMPLVSAELRVSGHPLFRRSMDG